MDTLRGVTVVVPAGEQPDDETRDRLDAVVVQAAGRKIERRPGWSSQQLEAALAAWAARNAGQPDLRFRFDQSIGPSPLIAGASDIANADPEDRGRLRPWSELRDGSNHDRDDTHELAASRAMPATTPRAVGAQGSLPIGGGSDRLGRRGQ